MGLSGPVAAVILVGALLGQAGNLYVANRNAEIKVLEAREDWQRRHEAQLQDSIGIDAASFNNGNKRLTLTMNNTGEMQLNGSRLNVVVDGVDRTADITTHTVGGESTDVWNPWKQLSVIVQLTAKPTDAVVIDQYGNTAVKRGI